MTAHSDVTVTVNHPAEKVRQAFATKEYWEFIAANLSPEPGTLAEFDGTTAVLFEILPKSILPEAAQAMISADLKLKRTVNLGGLEGEGSTYDYVGDVKGTPVDFNGEITLGESDGATTLSYANEAKVNIPFMGAALEPKVGEALEEIFSNEAKLTEQWITENL
ncbi:DUF2505 domain-containing protein [Corynebacterium liangguodongii]|uniref:DUF2505 domain-containing protein n=1 Tax=Corynebacterium liangguodongii TaxID=2079535 RepID=A0A2S0WBX6_9CORY|nr:DUF2505 domain-containing protein [Corynebacterium liangguodongii]AWB83271.1 DUF2505 domain-containing protein [Corynebacterium liangguodongii]PWC00639.1 DUF2505 domain-containing protein [Corynebacterium liangguodongii]